MRRIMKTLGVFSLVFFLLSVCVFAGEGKKGDSSAEDGKAKKVSQEEKPSDSGEKEAVEEEQLTFSPGTEELDKAAVQDIKIDQDGSFDKEDVKRCQEVLGNILIGNTEEMGLREYSGLENITIGESATFYQEGKVRYCVVDPSPGMCQLNGFQLYSSDDGSSWQLSRFHRDLDLGDMYIADGMILYIDGVRMDPISAPVFSFDGGKTEKRFEPDQIKALMSLPALDGYCMCYPKVRYIDAEAKLAAFDWYMYVPENPDDEVCFYKTTVSFPDLKITEEEDMSGILKETKEYKKDGYIFSGSGSEKLDQAAVRSRFLKEYRLAGAGRTAEEIRLAVNEIYARHGQDFQEEDIRFYFDSKKWYKPIEGKTVKDSELNDAEKANAAFLKRLEKEYRAVIRPQ